jgi:hypothetical protein
MNIKSLSRAGWWRGVLGLCLALTISGCAQSPTRSDGPRRQESSWQPSTTAADDQRRAMFIAGFTETLKRDDFYENTLGVSRNMPAYEPFKERMTALYTDELVLDWIYAQMTDATGTDVVMKRLSGRMFDGLGRLDDANALPLLTSLGEVMGRLSNEDCTTFTSSNGKSSGGFGRMLEKMEPSEVRDFFGALHQGIRADLLQRPLRPTPTGEQIKTVFTALEHVVPGGLYAKTSNNNCVTASRLMLGLKKLNGPTQGHAITFFLAQMGFYAKKTATAQKSS